MKVYVAFEDATELDLQNVCLGCWQDLQKAKDACSEQMEIHVQTYKDDYQEKVVRSSNDWVEFTDIAEGGVTYEITFEQGNTLIYKIYELEPQGEINTDPPLDRLLYMIQTELFKRPGKPTQEEVHQAACWFVSWYEATEMRDYSLREMAEFIQGGCPQVDIGYVEEWVNTYVSEFEEEVPGEDAYDTIQGLVNQHFGA